MSRNRNRNRNGRAPKRAAGGGGGGDYTNITFTEFSFPHGDDLFSDVAGTSAVNKSLDNQSTRRINPTALVAAWGTYHSTSVSPYGSWKNAANGINGYGVLRPGTLVSFLPEKWSTGKSFGDVVNADSCVYGLCGRIVANPDGTRYIEYWDNPGTDSMVTAVLNTGVVRVTMRMASAQTHNLDVTPDGDGLFSIVVWFHDGKIDYWLNGTKQTQITGVNNFNSVAGGAQWRPIVNGGGTLSWDLLCKAWAESHAVEADVQALSDHFESLLGR